MFPGQGTLLAACLEHLPAWTLHNVQQLQQQLLQSSFHFSSVFRDLCLQQLLFPKVVENLDAFMFFSPSLWKKIFKILMFAIEKRIIMFLKTKSLFEMFREPSGGFLQWERANLLTALPASFFPFSFIH